ncbi:MAG TPA: hypothetical protein PLN79_11060 [bacterium]|nr:hypothetical protein [bacterium]
MRIKLLTMIALPATLKFETIARIRLTVYTSRYQIMSDYLTGISDREGKIILV